MTQTEKGNLIGALKKESNLTIKQALNIVFITFPKRPPDANQQQTFHQTRGNDVFRIN